MSASHESVKRSAEDVEKLDELPSKKLKTEEVGDEITGTIQICIPDLEGVYELWNLGEWDLDVFKG